MRERGVIVASGFMAGGALGGVIGAALRLFPWYREDLVRTPFFDIEAVSQTGLDRGVLAVLSVSVAAGDASASGGRGG